MGRFYQNLNEYVNKRLEAAENGQPEAYYDLGLLYSTGQGVKRDFISAHKWFNLAALKGMKRAQVDRAELAREMNAREIAEAQKKAREWQKLH